MDFLTDSEMLAHLAAFSPEVPSALHHSHPCFWAFDSLDTSTWERLRSMAAKFSISGCSTSPSSWLWGSLKRRYFADIYCSSFLSQSASGLRRYCWPHFLRGCTWAIQVKLGLA